MGGSKVGGIIGLSKSNGRLNDSYVNVGSIVANNNMAGGIIGENRLQVINNTYVNGNYVEGDSIIGGLVGSNKNLIKRSYASINVKTTSQSSGVIGGLAGQNGQDAVKCCSGSDGVLEDSYWDKTVFNGNAIGKDGDDASDGDGGTNSGGDSIINGDVSGLTTGEMQGSSASSNMKAFDFGSNWTTVSGDYPELQY